MTEILEISTPYGRATIGPDWCSVAAENHELYAWATRSGDIWRCSDLVTLDTITAGFDTNGLVNLEQCPEAPREDDDTPNVCPDCGEDITLQPSGWWSHDRGSTGECWRLSLDGPDDDETDTVEIAGDELSAWTSTVLREALPGDHPCWLVCVGQFIGRDEWPQSAINVWGN